MYSINSVNTLADPFYGWVGQEGSVPKLPLSPLVPGDEEGLLTKLLSPVLDFSVSSESKALGLFGVIPEAEKSLLRFLGSPTDFNLLSKDKPWNQILSLHDLAREDIFYELQRLNQNLNSTQNNSSFFGLQFETTSLVLAPKTLLANLQEIDSPSRQTSLLESSLAPLPQQPGATPIIQEPFRPTQAKDSTRPTPLPPRKVPYTQTKQKQTKERALQTAFKSLSRLLQRAAEFLSRAAET